MSKPISRSSFDDAATMPTTPPAGPDRIASLPRKALASVRPPFDCMNCSFVPAGKSARHAIDVAAQDGREIGVDDCRVAAPDQLDQRRDLVADRHLRKAEFARDFGDALLVLGELPAVHQYDGQRVDPALAHLAKRKPRGVFVQRSDDLAVRADALDDLDDLFIRLLGQDDMPRENLRPRLVSDAQGVAEAARDRQRHPRALALEQCIGGDGGAHAHLAERAAFGLEDALDPLDRGVGIVVGIFGQQFLGPEPALVIPGDHVGERAAAIDREVPGAGHAAIKQMADSGSIANERNGGAGVRTTHKLIGLK